MWELDRNRGAAPWSARVPLDPLLCRTKHAEEGVGRGMLTIR